MASIRSGGFPRLNAIRAPSDHYGTIQAVCKPRAQIELASDWSAKAIAEGIAPGGLRAARRAAQQRLEDAWATVQYKLVIEEAGIVNEVFDFSGFMGTVESGIEYVLEPDLEGSDRALVDFPDLTNCGMAEISGKGVQNPVSVGQRLCTHPSSSKWRDVNVMMFF